MTGPITLFAPSKSSWIETDYKILSSITETEFINVNEISFLKWLFTHRRFDVAFFWFGSLRYLPYLIVARLLRRKIVIVAGGYDVNNIPELRYGAFQESGLKRFLRRCVFSFADRVLAVSRFTEDKARENLTVPLLRIRQAHLAIAAPNVSITPWDQRKRQIAFLISADSSNRLVKGLDLIPEICRRLPDVSFKLAGRLSPMVREELISEEIPNLEILGMLPFHSDAFVQMLNDSRVICCPSRCESFGAAVLDGLLLGCHPVAFASGAIPEILDGIGTVVRPGDIAAMVAALRERVDAESGVDRQTIAKVKQTFGETSRRDRLEEALSFSIPNSLGLKGRFLYLIRNVSLALPLIYPGLRYRIVRATLWLFQIKTYDFEVDFFGYRYRGNIQNHIDFHVFFLGAYETGILNLIRSLSHRDSVAFDIGANMGHHSLFFSRYCGRVDSFEPYEPVRKVLQERLDLNNISNVRIHPVGLGDEDTLAEFYEPPADNLGIGSFFKSHSEFNESRGLKLQLRKGDSVAQELKLERLDLIKIDVEDAERSVLIGLKNAMEKFSPHIIVEVCRANVADPEFAKLFPEHYQLFYIRNGFRERIRLEPFFISETPAYVYARPSLRTKRSNIKTPVA